MSALRLVIRNSESPHGKLPVDAKGFSLWPGPTGRRVRRFQHGVAVQCSPLPSRDAVRNRQGKKRLDRVPASLLYLCGRSCLKKPGACSYLMKIPGGPKSGLFGAIPGCVAKTVGPTVQFLRASLMGLFLHQAIPRAIAVGRIGHRLHNVVLSTASFASLQNANLLDPVSLGPFFLAFDIPVLPDHEVLASSREGGVRLIVS